MTNRRLRWWLTSRRLGAATRRSLMPPPPEAFASFGEGSVLVPPTRVHNPGCIEIGSGVSILELAFLSAYPGVDGVEPRIVIGDGTRISPMVTVACSNRVEIGRKVLFAAGSFVGDASHAFEDPTTPIIDQGMGPADPVVIGDGAFVGIRCVILPGSRIGEGAFIGAGSVVRGEVPPLTVAAGNPARVIRHYDAERGWVRVDD